MWLSSVIFLVVGLVHLARVLSGWDVTIGTFDVPMWASWVGLVVAFVLSYSGFKQSKNY